MLVDLARLSNGIITERQPDVADSTQLVSFGTSGHRGSSLNGTFTEAHILAITQAICDHRRGQGTDGPLYAGKDTHALSHGPGPAHRPSRLASIRWKRSSSPDDGVTPTPVISISPSWCTIRLQNRSGGRHRHHALHNPPEDGGFKYNPTNGGPADTDVTRWVQDRANELLRGKNAGVKRVPLETALKATTTHQEDFILPYVNDLRTVVDMGCHLRRGVEIGGWIR